MAITAQDIQEQSFSIDRKGYDVDEVDVFLERLADEVGFMNEEIEQKAQTIADLQSQLDDINMAGFDAPSTFNEEEQTRAIALDDAVTTFIGEDDAEELSADVVELQNQVEDLKKQLAEKTADSAAISAALIVAQRSADDIVSNAKVEANRIIKEANVEADRIIKKAESDREKVQFDIDGLEDDRDEVCDKYRNVLADFIADAQRKLDQVNATYNQPLASHARSAADTGEIAAAPFQAAANYQVPVMASAADASAPVAFSGDKDLSGFGDVVDDFNFDDPE